MKISVITINLNNKEGLRRTVKSVIEQTAFGDIEYIIIDGGSTDGSLGIIEENKEKITYYVSERDRGLYNAMNKGIDVATGDYCIFLNSGDNFCDKNVIEKIIPHLREDVVYGNIRINDSWVKKYADELDEKYFSVETLPHPGSFIRTKLIKACKYDESYEIISDWIMFIELIIKQKRSYKHVNITVSNFWLGGVSSNVKKVNAEKNIYINEEKHKHIICVIIPCYNYARYITETLDSLKDSTYKNFHCIIVNDGSTDNSEEVILNNIKEDERFEYFKIENGGLSHARNFGIKKSDSKYILCLDSDDKISQTYIENAVKYLEEHPDTAIYYGRAKMFYDNGIEHDWNLPPFNYKQLLICNHIYCSFVYRRKDYELRGGYDENMNGYEDWEFLIRLLYRNDKVYRSDDVVFYYRRHSDSMDFKQQKDVNKYINYIVQKNVKIYKNSGIAIKL